MHRPALPFALVVLLGGLTAALVAQDSGGPFAHTKDDPALPRVLILGDSISIGYTVPVRQMLQGQANVHRPPENCGPTTFGLERLDAWLGDGAWDLIHFNFGLHDMKYIDDEGDRVDPAKGRVQSPPEQYAANLRRLVERLSATGAKLVWCTTTPVPPGALGRIPGDAANYNSLAAEVIAEAGSDRIVVNDLYGFVHSQLDAIQRQADVHFTPEGSRQLGRQVAETIRRELQLPPPTPATARGVVFEDLNGNQQFDAGDRPLSGIRVSNGEQIVASGQRGEYVLPVDDDAVLFVLKPRGFRTPLDENKLPRFYYTHKPYGSPGARFAGVSPTGALPASVDFPLYRQDEPDQFKALLFGDPQPRTQQEVDFIAHDVVEEVIDADASFGVTLGDIVFDDLSLFESQARMIALIGIPWYNVIGNHDLNYDAPNDALSDESFQRVFGPAYYAFDHGPVHFLVLDDVEWFVDDASGEGSYRGGLGQRQMEFIRRDLAAIPDDRLVVLMMHIPLTDVGDRRELYRLIERRPFCLSISAHTHTHEHRLIGQEDGWLGPQPHHHLVNVTVCGSWWSGARDERNIPHTLMADGAPNGYSILSFDGQQYHLDFRAAGRPADYQMSIHAPEEWDVGSDEPAEVYVNVFNGSEQTHVEMRVGAEGPWTTLRKVAVEDPYYRRVYDAEATIVAQLQAAGRADPPWLPLTRPKPSTHLWQGTLTFDDETPVGTHLIHVRTRDEQGRQYTGKRIVRVTQGAKR